MNWLVDLVWKIFRVTEKNKKNVRIRESYRIVLSRWNWNGRGHIVKCRLMGVHATHFVLHIRAMDLFRKKRSYCVRCMGFSVVRMFSGYHQWTSQKMCYRMCIYTVAKRHLFCSVVNAYYANHFFYFVQYSFVLPFWMCIPRKLIFLSNNFTVFFLISLACVENESRVRQRAHQIMSIKNCKKKI